MAKIGKDGIAKAYVDLLVELPGERIAVKQVLRRAGITRNTFYYHFSNSQDLEDYVVGRFVGSLREHLEWDSGVVREVSPIQMGEFDPLDSSMHVLLSFFYQERELFSAILRTHLRDRLREQVMELVGEWPRRWRPVAADGTRMSDGTTRLWNHTIAWSFMGSLEYWAEEGFRTSLEDFERMLDEFYTSMGSVSFERFVPML